METFVGAGGSYLGLKKAGFKTVYVNEIDKNFAKMENAVKWPFYRSPRDG